MSGKRGKVTKDKEIKGKRATSEPHWERVLTCEGWKRAKTRQKKQRMAGARSRRN